MHKDLSHLSSNEVETLMQRYYNGESATVLIDEYHLSVRASNLYTLFPPITSTDEVCPYCGKNLVHKTLSRSAMAIKDVKQLMYCPTCHHMPYSWGCHCQNCLQKHQVEQDLREQKIREVFSTAPAPVNFYDLLFDQKVFLGALIRSLGQENLFDIKSYANSNVVLTPTNELCTEMYRTLLQNNIIAISPDSPIDAFVMDDFFPNTIYPHKATYHINLYYPEDKQALIDDILNPTYYSPVDQEAALNMWKKIALGECLQYLKFSLTKVKFPFTPGPKTYKVFDMLLNDFSTAQIYGIIWKAVAATAKLQLEKGLSKNHAANAVITACERIGERARLQGWNLAEYRRIAELPQSELSAFFFNRVLGIGDLGFTSPPQII